MYVCVLALGLSAATQAQVADFESFGLSPESYDNGSSGSGGFDLNGDLLLSNYYDVAWDSWTGFAISNVTDNVTAGWGNQYSAYPGSGANGSATYAMAYQNPVIQSNVYAGIDSLKITNGTYPAISMRDGDGFAKQFGSPYDVNGQLDGTNGEDFFKIWIICEDWNNAYKDSIEFYLADYRFQDSTLDYIVDEWVNIDLTSLSFPVARISFTFESSDMGQWGMNTPAYFAVDDIHYQVLWGLEELSAASLNVFPNPAKENFRVECPLSGVLRVTDLAGSLVYSGSHNGLSSISCEGWSDGVYLVNLVTDSGVVSTRLLR